MVGSSSVAQRLGRVIGETLEHWGYRVTRRGIASAGLARPDFCDLKEVVDGLSIGRETAAVFVYFGVNDAQSLWLRPSERGANGARWVSWHDPRWADIYTRRAADLYRSICDRGAGRAVVLLPVEVEKASLERKLRRVRRLQRQAAAQVNCAVAVSTAGERGRFSRNGRRLRLRDGFHLSPLGARLVWSRVQHRANLSFDSLALSSVGALPP